MDNPRVIVVDDDEDLRETLLDYLSENGIDVFDASNGAECRAMLGEISADLAILDLKMPGEDGLSLCRHVRETSNMGIIILTGATDPIDRVAGLEIGADDYIAKPFEPRELLARIRSVLRRTRAASMDNRVVERDTSEMTFGDCKVSLVSRTVKRADGQSENLTQMETELLKIFAERPGKILSREALLNLTGDGTGDSFDRSIDLRVMRLRKKIELDSSQPKYILTLRGEGYRYEPNGGD